VKPTISRTAALVREPAPTGFAEPARDHSLGRDELSDLEAPHALPASDDLPCVLVPEHAGEPRRAGEDDVAVAVRLEAVRVRAADPARAHADEHVVRARPRIRDLDVVDGRVSPHVARPELRAAGARVADGPELGRPHRRRTDTSRIARSVALVTTRRKPPHSRRSRGPEPVRARRA
jgi:hypothetical protein